MGDDHTAGEVFQNYNGTTLLTGDVLVHRNSDILPDDHLTVTEGLKALDLGDGDRGDDTSTTSSGVSSAGSSGVGSATISMSSGSAAPSPDKDKKKFDVSLTSWNIWQEDDEFAPPSDEEDEGISTSSSGLRRFKSVDYSTIERNTKKRFSGFLRRFSLRDSHEVSPPKREAIELKPRQPKEVRVDSLPQYFVVKHLGSRRATGLFGTQHVRKPVDEMVAAVGNLRRGQDLTLAQLHVTKKGVHLSSHADNKGPNLPAEFVPLEFVSYGAQDIVNTRIFCLVLVRTVSRHAKQAECHAFACNCSATAKKIALSVGLAFKKYAAALKDKPHKFEVDLDKGQKREEVRRDRPRAEYDA